MYLILIENQGIVDSLKSEVTVLVAQLCPTLCNFMDCSQPGFSVHGILLARILEQVTIPFSSGSSQLRDQTWVSLIAGRFFTILATRETLWIFQSLMCLSVKSIQNLMKKIPEILIQQVSEEVLTLENSRLDLQTLSTSQIEITKQASSLQSDMSGFEQ